MNNNAAPALRIVRVISIVDTRDFEEISDGVFAPVEGSGDEHECSRCGRLHLIHATVELSDGSTTIVGTGCAKGESMAVQGALNSGARKATELAALRAKLAKRTTRLAEINAEIAEKAPRVISVRSDLLPDVSEITRTDRVANGEVIGAWFSYGKHKRGVLLVDVDDGKTRDHDRAYYTSENARVIARAQREILTALADEQTATREAAGEGVSPATMARLAADRIALTEEISALQKKIAKHEK